MFKSDLLTKQKLLESYRRKEVLVTVSCHFVTSHDTNWECAKEGAEILAVSCTISKCATFFLGLVQALKVSKVTSI
jgi:hypothetical protein